MEEKWIINDIETGEPIEVTKAVYDLYNQLLAQCKPLIDESEFQSKDVSGSSYEEI